MIVEMCRRLASIAPLHTYQYVGFGALEYIDFELMHRELSISRMTSIEQDTTHAERFEFNKPFRSIELRMGPAHQHLPDLDWSLLSIVWLDYECQLTEQCLRDVETLGRVLRPGSLLLVTVQAGAPAGTRHETLTANLGASRLPLGLTEQSLEGPWNFADIQRSVVDSALHVVVELQPHEASASQLLNIRYADNAKMQTVGWIISSPEVAPRVAACCMDDLPFSRTDAKALELRVPVLTRRELAYLNRLLPLKKQSRLKEKWLDELAQEQYADIYRYYPNYHAITG